MAVYYLGDIVSLINKQINQKKDANYLKLNNRIMFIGFMVNYQKT